MRDSADAINECQLTVDIEAQLGRKAPVAGHIIALAAQAEAGLAADPYEGRGQGLAFAAGGSDPGPRQCDGRPRLPAPRALVPQRLKLAPICVDFCEG